MKKRITLLLLNFIAFYAFGQYAWDNVWIAPSPGSGKVWELQENVSDDFNYEDPGAPWVHTFNDRWINYYHGNWSGPQPTVWKREHVFVEDGNFKVIASRPPGDSLWVEGQKLAVTNLGCAHSVNQVVYPVFVEANVKIMNSVLSSGVWMLSSDDTQEIDICEAYGSDRWNNAWFNPERLHLSHHVFIRDPFQDWQPSDPGSFYTDNSTVWREEYHRIGVYWQDSVNLKYYVDGQLVRTRSGMDEIDPVYFTNEIDPGDPTNDTRTGLNKPMDIIIDTEDQTWRAVQGLTPTDDELADEENNTFQVDWIRVYKPVDGMVGPVTAVSINPPQVTTFVDDEFTLTAEIVPYNALDLSVVWESLDPNIATVNQDGVVETHNEGVTQIVVTTNENNKKDTCTVTVQGIPPSLEFINAFTYTTFDYEVGGELLVKCEYHAGTGNTVVDGGNGGVKFWLREIEPGWLPVNDYVISDSTTIGTESGIAEGVISLQGVPAVSDIPSDNWYFLYITFENSDNDFFDNGIYPISIIKPSNVFSPEVNPLEIFPNPAQSTLYINPENLKGDFTIQLIAPSGQLIDIQEFDASQSNIELDISGLPDGFYMVKVVGDEVFLGAFVKE